MSEIVNITAREILDSRGNPTIEAEVHTASGAKGSAMVPSGASTGVREALELRDKDQSRYLGKGVQKAIQNIAEKIMPELKTMEVNDQAAIDEAMISLDACPTRATAAPALNKAFRYCRK